MKLLITDAELVPRRDVVRGPLRPLALSLARDLEPLLGRDLYFPSEKALLSREGGRCARDGTLLEFDPFQPHEHVCPRCGQVYRGELHDRFWIYWYQLWLAERAVHAAALYALGVDDRFGPLAVAILDGYAERYARYPNVDNVLGPTRLFFSTYLESIWLLQICVATDLLDAAESSLTNRIRDRIIEPSRAIIGQYDEGGSNRQVWNDAALLAAARLVGDERAAEAAVYGPSGIVTHLTTGLLADGTWFEGENYHLFAHRGLWYGVTMTEQAGFELPPTLVDRFQRGFATPFATALPDFTLPSRRDSQYAISLRQWRIAEHCELGVARRADPVLIGALERMYCDDGPSGETGRRTSSADAERNARASSLSRADLSWRALLRALPNTCHPPRSGGSAVSSAPGSVLLDAQGIAVFRRDEDRSYVALDYGHSGGGHGHPDRLNLLLATGKTRWLDDPGTGSYVDPSLHWYRSTLAHNAPLFDGRSQRRVNGVLVAHDERGAAGWIVASADELSEGAGARRTVVVMPGYLIDQVVWHSEAEVVVDLPIHADIRLDASASPIEPAMLEGGDGLEDGFRFLRDTERQFVSGGVSVWGSAKSVDDVLNVWAMSDQDTEWWRAVALGPPGSGDHAFRILRARAKSGRHRFVMAWSSEVVNVELGVELRVTLLDGTSHVHRRLDTGWQVELHAGDAQSTIDLAGFVDVKGTLPFTADAKGSVPFAVGRGKTIVIELGERHYRRSEESWHDAGRPSAIVTVSREPASLRINIAVAPSDLTFVTADAVNRYDNEPAHINGDSVQLYLLTDRGQSGWLLIPVADSNEVIVRPIEGWTAPQRLRAEWRRSGAGYQMDVEIDGHPLALDVIVNEMPRGRERRRGQLVMSGGEGEFVYLRGDRHEASRLLHLRDADG